MCNLYSITTNQEAIRALFRVVNRYVGNLAPMPGVFPDYPAPVIRNTETGFRSTRHHSLRRNRGCGCKNAFSEADYNPFFDNMSRALIGALGQPWRNASPCAGAVPPYTSQAADHWLTCMSGNSDWIGGT